MRTVIITTHQGKIVFSWKRHGHFLENATALAHVLEASFVSREKTAFVQWQDTLYTVRRYSLGLALFWTIQACPLTLMRHHLHEILSRYPWPSCLTSQEGEILFSNSALCKILGYDSRALMGKHFLELCHKVGAAQDPWHHAFYTLKNLQGTLVPVVVSHTFSQGPWVALFLFPADVTGASMGDLGWLGHIPMPAALLDDNGGLSIMNSLLRDKMPWKEGSSLMQWMAEKDRALFSQALRRLRRSQETGNKMPIHIRNQEGESVLAFLRYIITDGQGLGRFLILFHSADDMAWGKEAEPYKMQLLGQLASGIVHDFNNLLTGILGFCDLLLQRHCSGDPSFKDIQQIKQSAMRAARLIQKLLAFSRSVPTAHHVISLAHCLRELFPLVHRMVGPKILLVLEKKKDIQEYPLSPHEKAPDALSQTPSSQEEISDDPFCIFGDVGQLEQILLNLSINARDAMTDGGVLTFSLSLHRLKAPHAVMKRVLTPRDYVVIDITDTGSGIDPQHMERIFDPFFSTKDPGQGTGLGLSNVLDIMGQFDGGIQLTTALGKGSTFSLYFPQHARGARRQERGKLVAKRRGPDVSDVVSGTFGAPGAQSPFPSTVSDGGPQSATRLAGMTSREGLKGRGGVSDDAPDGQYHSMSHHAGGDNRRTVAPSQRSVAREKPLKGSQAHGPNVQIQASEWQRILLVEDEDPVRLFAARALREKGHHVIEARDGAQALNALEAHGPFTILVTDVMMPGVDGPSLAAAALKMIPDIKILFVSGYPEEEVRVHFPNAACPLYFLPKPFTLADLVNRIHEISHLN